MIQEVPAAGNISNTTGTAAGGLSTNGGETRIISPRLTGVLQPSHSSSSSTTTTTTTGPTQENQNPLKCPRCASSNTKFCYYNNYNLTQPRHFCKTCRRYWTKGGALRNVPIGGGCRKNVNKPSVSHVIPSSIGKPYNTGKFMRQHLVSSEKIGNTLGGCDPAGMSTNSILWTTPQANHLLALLKSTQDQNPNPNLTYQILNGSGNVGAGGLCLDPLNNQIMSSFWRNKVQYEAELQQQNMNGYFMGQKTNHYADQHNNQRVPAGLQSTENYYLDNYGAGISVGNVHASSSNSSGILESAPVVARAELGHCWNNTSLSWPDLPTTNGAYHN